MKQVMKKVWRVLQKIIISTFILYGYNLIVTPINLTIPINLITVGLLTVFGIPALFALIIILIVVF